MFKVNYSVCLLVGAFLSGCASSGPVPMGRDTFMMSQTGAWSWSSGSALKGNLYAEADQFCRSKGREMMPVSTRQNNANMTGTFAHAEIQFRCLLPGDPELSRPTMEPVPNTVIKVQ
jgi:hypothetical protein